MVSGATPSNRGDALPPARKSSHFTHFTHQTPQPDTGNDGHRLIKKCLAKSAKREVFSIDGGETAALCRLLDATDAVPGLLQHRYHRLLAREMARTNGDHDLTRLRHALFDPPAPVRVSLADQRLL